MLPGAQLGPAPEGEVSLAQVPCRPARDGSHKGHPKRGGASVTAGQRGACGNAQSTLRAAQQLLQRGSSFRGSHGVCQATANVGPPQEALMLFDGMHGCMGSHP